MSSYILVLLPPSGAISKSKNIFKYTLFCSKTPAHFPSQYSNSINMHYIIMVRIMIAFWIQTYCFVQDCNAL